MNKILVFDNSMNCIGYAPLSKNPWIIRAYGVTLIGVVDNYYYTCFLIYE